MAIDKTKILADEYSTEIIQKLSDNPNESGLNAEQLKIAFDTGATNIRDYIKDSLIDDINGELTTLGTADTTLSNEIGTLANLTTTAKSNLVGAVNEVKSSLDSKTYDTGWQNLTKTKGTWYYLRYRVIGKIVCVEGYASSFKWSGSTGDTIVNAGIPSQYRPSNTTYAMSAFSGTRIARAYVSSGGSVGIDYVINISNGADYTTASWLQFKIIYFID